MENFWPCTSPFWTMHCKQSLCSDLGKSCQPNLQYIYIHNCKGGTELALTRRWEMWEWRAERHVALFVCLFVCSLIQVSQTLQHRNLEFPFVKENFGAQKWKFIYKLYMRKAGEGKEWFIIMAYIPLHIPKFQGNIFFFVAWIINHHSITKGEYLDGTAAFVKNTSGRWMTGKFMDNSVAWLSCLQERSLCQYLNLSWQFTQQTKYVMEWGFTPPLAWVVLFLLSQPAEYVIGMQKCWEKAIKDATEPLLAGLSLGHVYMKNILLCSPLSQSCPINQRAFKGHWYL